MTDHRDDPDLHSMQRWMQELICFPLDLDEGPGADLIEDRILPSDRLSAKQRLDIYSQQYFLRLGSVLEEDFPCVRHAMGKDAFWKAARGFLVTHPSHSFTLNHLGAPFPDFLEHVDHAARAFLVELAILEWTCQVTFHAQACESLKVEDLSGVELERWAEARFVPIHALSLHTFQYPVNEYFKAVRRGDAPTTPEPTQTFLACYRKDDRVWRMDLDVARYTLLSALVDGMTLAEALERAAEAGADPQELAGNLTSWFTQWMQEGLFRDVAFA